MPNFGQWLSLRREKTQNCLYMIYLVWVYVDFKLLGLGIDNFEWKENLWGKENNPVRTQSTAADRLSWAHRRWKGREQRENSKRIFSAPAFIKFKSRSRDITGIFWYDDWILCEQIGFKGLKWCFYLCKKTSRTLSPKSFSPVQKFFEHSLVILKLFEDLEGKILNSFLYCQKYWRWWSIATFLVVIIWNEKMLHMIHLSWVNVRFSREEQYNTLRT